MSLWLPPRDIYLPSEGQVLSLPAQSYQGGVGTGIQGATDINWVCRYADVILCLEGEMGYARDLGPRAWVRFLNHGTEWRDSGHWAQHCAESFLPAYQAGCRVMIPINEPNLGGEGGGDSESDYIWLGQWGVNFINSFRSEAGARGMPDVIICAPCLSPGHRENDLGTYDTLYQGYYRHMVDFLRMVDIIGGHYYWPRQGGFLDDADAWAWSRRIQYDQEYFRRLGINKPMAVTEFNRDEGAQGNVPAYMEQLKRYYGYLAGLSVAQFYFIATATDAGFYVFALNRMAGAMDILAAWHPGSCGVQPCQPPAGGCPSGTHWDQGACACVPDTPQGGPWAARWVSQSSAPTLRTGEVASAQLTLKNVGDETWYRDQAPVVRLGTSSPRDRSSAFAGGSGWLSSNRIRLPVDSVAPQQTVVIAFDWTVPPDLAPGVYHESFGLVAEGETWFPSLSVSWDITIVPGISPPMGTLPILLLSGLGVAAVAAAVLIGRSGGEAEPPAGYEYVAPPTEEAPAGYEYVEVEEEE